MKGRLFEFGLDEYIKKEFENYNYNNNNKFLGRVIAEYKGIYKVATEELDIMARVNGNFIKSTEDSSSYPGVGDWIVIDRTSNKNGDGIILKVLPRKSYVSRKVAGIKTDEQIIASNIDTLFICMSCNNDFNLRRLERYIAIGWDSGATPVVIITKIDLCDDVFRLKSELEEITVGIDVVYLSSITSDGTEGIDKYLNVGQTIGFIGSSGVGKSTLINYLIGEEKMNVSSIRESDQKGKHTTTHRELIVIKDKGIVIDTPGMREVQLMDNVDGIETSFKDISSISVRCKFNDCKHNNEPGCAVREAIQNGSINVERLDSYNKLMREAKFIEKKNILKARQEDKKKRYLK